MSSTDRQDEPAAEPSGESPPGRQFSLRGLLWFVVACSAYFSQVAAGVRMISDLERLDQQPSASLIMTLLLSWCLLGGFLRTKGLRGMLVAHCLGPGIMLFIALYSALGIVAQGGTPVPLKMVGFALAHGCFVSSLLSFPASVLYTVGGALSARRRADDDK